MAMTEHNGLMIYQDAGGDKYILYPITKAALVDGLEELLNALDSAKSNTGHKHVAADVTDLAGLLAAKSNTGHKHVAADVTDLGAYIASLGAAKVEVGSYVGTGYYGTTYPNSITCSSVIKAIFMVGKLESSTFFSAMATGSSSQNSKFNFIMVADNLPTDTWSVPNTGFNRNTSNGGLAKKSADGKTFYWALGGISGSSEYASAGNQFNNSDGTYYYIAILE